ncbi:MAG: DNA translocase FtsK [Oscillospiraceae bacterium]|nr:DNA translocase FtsK [Oscillospiraceae bacterium]
MISMLTRVSVVSVISGFIELIKEIVTEMLQPPEEIDSSETNKKITLKVKETTRKMRETKEDINEAKEYIKSEIKRKSRFDFKIKEDERTPGESGSKSDAPEDTVMSGGTNDDKPLLKEKMEKIYGKKESDRHNRGEDHTDMFSAEPPDVLPIGMLMPGESLNGPHENNAPENGTDKEEYIPPFSTIDPVTGEIVYENEDCNTDADRISEAYNSADKKSEEKEDGNKEIPEDFDDEEIADVVFNPMVTAGSEKSNSGSETVEEFVRKRENGNADKVRKISKTYIERREEPDKENMTLIESLDDAAAEPHRPYVYPDINLLKEPKKPSGNIREEMRSTALKLIETLKSFNVNVKLSEVTQGPAVTRYEVQLEPGVKVSKIVGLSEDLAMNLAVSSILIAPVPGKPVVGIEVPNKKISMVSVRELIDSNEFRSVKSKLAFVVGKDIGGRIITADIAKMPHLLIAGSTGSGKSVFVNTMITSILYNASPDEVKLIMVDPKVVELGVYNGIPHLMIPVVTEPKQAAGALNWAVREMMKRYDLFAKNKVRNLAGYNKLAENGDTEKLPQILIIIDELADLMMVAAKEVEGYICRLAQLARAAGIHLVIATQRPSVDVITGLIKANIPSRAALFVSSQVDSRTVLGKGGAEKLLGNGDMLFHPSGIPNAMRVQGAYVSDEEIENVVRFLIENSDENSYAEDLAEHIERCANGENGVTPDEEDDGDELLPQAISIAIEAGQISTSMVQRRLGVGYARAGRIIDQMESRGIISGANGSKPREVLLTAAEVYGNS